MTQSTSQDEATYTDLPVGEILKRTRMHYGQSPEDIESNTRIRAHLVIAIEENDPETMPARVYAIGFIRSYADYLGLNGEKMVELYKAQVVSEQEAATSKTRKNKKPNMDDHNGAPPWVLILTILVGLIAGGVWLNSSQQEREILIKIPNEVVSAQADEEASVPEQGAPVKEAAPVTDKKISVNDIPPVPEMLKNKIFGDDDELSTESDTAPEQGNTNSEENDAVSTETEQKAPQKGVGKGDIILNIMENSWVEIRDSGGKRILSRVLNAGDQYYVPSRPDLTISLGNAGGVHLEIDGVKLKALGDEAQVKRDIPLDAEYLKKNFAE